MSSFRKAAPRPEHKERGQLSHRKKLGILEKHSDYVLRARDYHAKEKRLAVLTEKARLKNPDEFYFGMISSSTKDDIHHCERKPLTHEMIQLMKSQDLNYIQYQKNVSLNKLNRLKNFHPELCIEKSLLNSKRTHLLFDEESLEAKQQLSPILDTKTMTALHTGAIESKNLKREIKAREERENQLRKVTQSLQIQKLLNSKGKRKKVGVNKEGIPVYKWNNERKK